MKNLTYLLFLVMLIVSSCHKRELANSGDSIDDLAKRALEAIASNDIKNLDALRINRDEFKKYLWPEFPASKNHVPFDFAWDNLNGKTIKGMSRALSDIGGQEFNLVNVTFEENDDPYSSFVIHTRTVLQVTDPDGKQKQIKFFGSIVERNGEFKFLSYRD
ncbi:hypothetical protein F9K33_14240 [bacterium]|nr:MAG: hypothetical protein F9K33_14240 [bacterium]